VAPFFRTRCRYKNERSVAFKIRQKPFSAGDPAGAARSRRSHRPLSRLEREHPSPNPTLIGTDPPSEIGARHASLPEVQPDLRLWSWFRKSGGGETLNGFTALLLPDHFAPQSESSIRNKSFIKTYFIVWFYCLVGTRSVQLTFVTGQWSNYIYVGYVRGDSQSLPFSVFSAILPSYHQYPHHKQHSSPPFRCVALRKLATPLINDEVNLKHWKSNLGVWRECCCTCFILCVLPHWTVEDEIVGLALAAHSSRAMRKSEVHETFPHRSTSIRSHWQLSFSSLSTRPMATIEISKRLTAPPHFYVSLSVGDQPPQAFCLLAAVRPCIRAYVIITKIRGGSGGSSLGSDEIAGSLGFRDSNALKKNNLMALIRG